MHLWLTRVQCAIESRVDRRRNRFGFDLARGNCESHCTQSHLLRQQRRCRSAVVRDKCGGCLLPTGRPSQGETRLNGSRRVTWNGSGDFRGSWRERRLASANGSSRGTLEGGHSCEQWGRLSMSNSCRRFQLWPTDLHWRQNQFTILEPATGQRHRACTRHTADGPEAKMGI